MLKVKDFEYHAAVRARVHLGVEYTDELKTDIVREIKRASRRRGDGPDLLAVKLYDSYRGNTVEREVWSVTVEERVFKVVYDPRKRTIVTFLRD